MITSNAKFQHFVFQIIKYVPVYMMFGGGGGGGGNSVIGL